MGEFTAEFSVALLSGDAITPAPSRWPCQRTSAAVAALVDAQRLGRCGGNPVEVQVLSAAPIVPALESAAGPPPAPSDAAVAELFAALASGANFRTEVDVRVLSAAHSLTYEHY